MPQARGLSRQKGTDADRYVVVLVVGIGYFIALCLLHWQPALGFPAQRRRRAQSPDRGR
jgi:hypothetical protein